ncbi:hypothetical protein G9A89_000937 [Geosiphon pyriformis]|nr:hypothetical protein G9A89_000937 [Geosiphon pyriformis]
MNKKTSKEVLIENKVNLVQIYQQKRVQILAWIRLLWPYPNFKTNSELARELTKELLLKYGQTRPSIVAQKEAYLGGYAIHTYNVIKESSNENGIPIYRIGEFTYGPREFLVSQCNSFQKPPAFKNDPFLPWDDSFLLNKLLPRLSQEALSIQELPAIFLTVKEALLRGKKDELIFKCQLCKNSCDKLYRYSAIIEHLKSSKHNWKIIKDD